MAWSSEVILGCIYMEKGRNPNLVLFTYEAKKLHKHDCALQKIPIPRN
jgi:hypothetical protein